MPETVQKISSQPNADAVQQTVANFSADGRDALEQDQRRSISDRISTEKQFQAFGILGITTGENIPSGQVQNVIRQTPAKSVSTVSSIYLADDASTQVFSALEKVFSLKLNITRDLSAFNKDAINRYGESLKAKLHQNKVELEAELEKITSQQVALHMSVIGAAVQLASTLLALGGSVLNQIVTRPDSMRAQEVQESPQRFGAAQTGRELPPDETSGEARVFVPGTNRNSAPFQERNIDARRESAQLEISLEEEAPATLVGSLSTRKPSEESQIDIALTRTAASPTEDVQIQKNVQLLRDQVAHTSMGLKDRIQLALTGFQSAGQAIGGIITQVGQAQAAQLEISALEAQKEARKSTAALDGYIQLIQSALKNVGKEQKEILKEADSILSVMEDRASSRQESASKVFRA